MSAQVLYPTQAPKPTTLAVIRSHAFWPEVQPSDLRKAMNIGDTISDIQLIHAAIEAVALTNQLLKIWRQRHQAMGIQHLAQIEPEDVINDQTVLALRYQRAIACFTKATTLEKYLDYDSTGKADTKAEAKRVQVDLYWRDGHAAISDMLGLNRIQSELL